MKRAAQTVLRLPQEEALHSLRIAPSDVVVEIGGGNSPFWRSDILVERFLGDDSQRSGPLVVDRPTVCADAHRLPFKANAFDYVFCSQILEHLADPSRFFVEIARVGTRGYIETPNELRERLIRRPCHEWVISLDGEVLVLKKNQLPKIFGNLFRELMANRLYHHFYKSHYWLFNIMIEWQVGVEFRFGPPAELDVQTPSSWMDTLDFRPEDVRTTRGVTLRAEPGVKESVRMFMGALSRSARRRFSRNVKRPKRDGHELLNDRLICPACGDGVTISWERNVVSCKACGRSYPIRSGVPIMLCDEHELEQTVRTFPR